MAQKPDKEGTAAGWYDRNEKVIRWGTMLGSWILGGVLAATGVGTGLGIAIISGGTAYGAGKPIVTGLLKARSDSKAAKAVTGEPPNNQVG